VAVLAGTVAVQPAEAQHARGSRVTSVTVIGTTPVGTFNGAAYVRVVGTLTGVVAAGERVAGLAGDTPYAAQFELITAAPGQPRSDAILVEAENRGSPLLLATLQDLAVSGPPATIVYPAGLGNGFLQHNGLAWARVQWQGPNAAAVVNPTIPLTAQGVGEVIVRDFGLLLRGTPVGRSAGLPRFDRALLAGVSQSAWFVNTFIAEGFNAAPGRVFDGAYTQDGVGNWLAINQINAARGFTAQTPYVQENGVPLAPTELLRRPLTDPFLVDTTAYTDFHRVRASVWNTARLPATVREYNLPVAHASAAAQPLGTTAAQSGCPALSPSPVVNPSDNRPFVRAAVLGLARRVGVRGLRGPAPVLARSTQFALRPGPTTADPALPLFNPLPGVHLKIPVTTVDNQPVGGARFPDAVLPLGVLTPASVPPVTTRSITETCGNLGGFRPFTAAELARRYGSAGRFLTAYTTLLDRLIRQGLVLPADRAGILAFAATRYAAAGQ
jgi:hypothetical protein